MRTLGPFILMIGLLLCGCSTSPHPRLIGFTAPDFTIKDSDRTISLHDLKGKPIVLNFWASYCPPCIVEMPSLVKLQQEMGSKITVLAVSIDEEEDRYHKFLRDHGITLLTAWDPEKKTSTLYGTVLIPETYVIDSSGRVRRKLVNSHDFTNPELVEFLSKL